MHYSPPRSDEIFHFGIKGMKWGVKRYQNEDGSLTKAGEKRYYNKDGSLNRKGRKFIIKEYQSKAYDIYGPTKDDPYQVKAHEKGKDFARRVEKGFSPSKKNFVKYVNPRRETAMDTIRKNIAAEREFFKKSFKKLKKNREKAKTVKRMLKELDEQQLN